MFKTSDLRDKDVIDVKTGKRLGNIIDIEVNLEEGKVDGFILPGETKGFRLFSKDQDLYIPWQSVKKIGEDVILIDINEDVTQV
ncbi:YlmC/YmxH family sporulation protein [Thermoanaerobacterium sp. R66]|uniref:YlmC/YmxH family sporulation protein n=1 Tax=Thermoanaerobacterium sp. R66 TaxID=2742479 RepID=UPI002380AAF7|nr:YlmC/YmxH family sporulation protein [Thermoanaerobacterium sp. R66]MDE4542048.1 YlmC/YmxH family sporulation protein [Thermoanaerobacterium sp. R66]